MSPAKLKRALDPIYVGATWAQEFQFFDQYQDQPLDLTGKVVTLSLDRKGLPDAHYDLTASVSGNVATVRSERVAFTPGPYAIELRIEEGPDLRSVVVGDVTVTKGAGARGEGTEGAQAQPSAVGVVFAETNVVQVINVGLSGTADAVSIPADIGALFGGAVTLGDVLRYLPSMVGGGGPAVRDLAGAVVVNAVAVGALTVEAASRIVLSGAVSAVSTATGSLTVATALTRALVGAVTAQSAAAGALTLSMGGGGQVTNIPAHANLREAFGIYNLKPGSGVFSGRVATVCAPGAPEPPTSTVDVFLDANGAPDLAPAVAAFGSELSFYQFHSQSGSGSVAQAVNAAGRLRLFVGEEFKHNGKYALHAVTGANYRVAAGEYQRQSLTFVEMVGGNMQGTNANSTSSLGANPQTLASSVSFLSEATGRGALGSSFVRSAGVYHGYHPEVATFVSSASSTKIRSGHRRDTLGTNTAATMTGINLGAGYYTADSKFYQGWLVYDAPLSDADELAVATAMATIHGTNLNVPAEILFERGDSITYDQGPPLPLHDGASARLARDRPQTKVVNAGVPGAVMADFPPAWFAARRVVGAKNVLKLGFGSNNWASASAPANDPQAVFGTDDVTPGTFRYAIANAKAAGVVPVVRTTIMRPGYTTAQAERRTAFNQLLRDNVAALGFLLVDFGDTVYPTVDLVHPTAAGYAAMHAIEGPVIAQAFSIAPVAA